MMSITQSFEWDQVYAVIDYETFSEAPLKKCGAAEYSVHPSTEIICVAWKIGTRQTLRDAKTESWAPNDACSGGCSPGEFIAALRDPNTLLVAHNALFEQLITRNVFATKYMYSKKAEIQAIPVNRWICTASLAATLALPRKLEGAADALKLNTRKDMEGSKLIMKWCKPRKPTKKDPSTRHTDPLELARVLQYCETDVDAETELFLRCPPLSETERKIWELDQVINQRGFMVDRPLIETVLTMIETESKILNDETDSMSFGSLASATQRDGVLEWLQAEGVFLPDLRKKTVDDALSDGLVSGEAKRMLELRQAISKTSTAKYRMLELRSRHDSRIRDILLYHGCSTGRWVGTGVQPQNLPKNSIGNSIQAAEILREGDLELVRLIYGDPMTVFSSCLRNTIVAPEGVTLDVADYAAIEARVLFWVARHEAGMQAFRDERDLYKEMAVNIFKVKISEVSTFQRFVAKQVMLGCGYSMGAKKFVAYCALMGKEVTQELADAAVASYRSIHWPVVRLWDNIGKAAIAAVQNPGKKYTINRTQWYVRDGFLICVLPSGRKLYYREPSVSYEETPWGEKRPCLYHFGVNSYTKKWENQKTYGGRLVENVVQGIARDLMAEAMLRIEARGPWAIVLSVHDELIAERDLTLGDGSIEEFNELMATLPAWAEGCPVKAEGFSSDRYHK